MVLLKSSFSLERQSFLDALRGMALFGILVVNIAVFSSPFYGSGLSNDHNTIWDQAISFLVAAVFETKFYLIFSFLFGYSFTIQMMSAEQKGKPFAKSFMRRLLGLWVLGVLHAVLLYHGDILSTYAVMGLCLYGLRKQSHRRLLCIASSLVLVTFALWFVLAMLLSGQQQDEANILQNIQAQQQAYLGSYQQIVGQHLQDLSSVWMITVVMQAPVALAMFCLGLVAGKKQLFLHLADYQADFVTVWRWGMLAGVPVALLHGYASVFGQSDSFQLLALSLSILTGPLLSAAYVVMAIWCFQHPIGQKVVLWFQSAGRMALSHYLMQSLLLTFVFFGVGLGWMGQLSPVSTFLLAWGIYAFLCVMSHFWLKYFQFGPVEWLLRSFTQWHWSHLLKSPDKHK